jgi:hypothetical protein
MSLSSTIAAGPRQHSNSQVQVVEGSWAHFTVSDLRLPQPGWPSPHIYISQEQGGPVLSPGTGFPFRRLLWLTGLRWRYSNPLPHGMCWTEHGRSRPTENAFFITSSIVVWRHHARICCGHYMATAVCVMYRDTSSIVVCGYYLTMADVYRVTS